MKRHHLIIVALLVATLLAYEPLRHNEFVRFDDGAYVFQNKHVLAGLTADSFAWAFNVGTAGNWHPLTWLSHMLDASLFGLDPWGHHRTSLVLHAASAVILFLLLRRLTGAEGKSAFVAAVFALHPLHVESVAWASERKDVLSTLLGFLSLWFWADWTKRGGRGRYLAALSMFALSLTAKPMLVSLPFLLLLMDDWPLARTGAGARATTGREGGPKAKRRGGKAAGPVNVPLAARLREKIPFFALAAISCVITVVAQSKGRALAGVDAVPLWYRVENAAMACASYLGKAIWPTKLAVFYPFAIGGISGAMVATGGLLVIVGTIAVLGSRRAHPWLAVGWLWWIVTLLPVVGIVQVGKQSMADRYTYVPMVGLAIVVAWGAEALVSRWKSGRTVVAALAIVVACAWVGVTRRQVRLWKDDITLFTHAAKVTQGNFLAHFRLGYDYMVQDKLDEAIAHYELSVRYNPMVADAHNDYGVALIRRGRYDESAAQFAEACRLKPGDGEQWFNLGRAQLGQGRYADAAKSIREGLRIVPNSKDGPGLLEQALRGQRK